MGGGEGVGDPLAPLGETSQFRHRDELGRRQPGGDKPDQPHPPTQPQPPLRPGEARRRLQPPKDPVGQQTDGADERHLGMEPQPLETMGQPGHHQPAPSRPAPGLARPLDRPQGQRQGQGAVADAEMDPVADAVAREGVHKRPERRRRRAPPDRPQKEEEKEPAQERPQPEQPDHRPISRDQQRQPVQGVEGPGAAVGQEGEADEHGRRPEGQLPLPQRLEQQHQHRVVVVLNIVLIGGEAQDQKPSEEET